jgi:acetoacetyl-CoA synthetase
MNQPVWTPSLERVERSNLRAWMDTLRLRHPDVGRDFPSFHRWSVEHLETFWGEAWRDAEVDVSRPHRAVLTDRAMPPVREAPNEVWFPGARFNFAQHLLRHRDGRVALVAEAEDQPRRTVTYRELFRQAACAAAAFRRLGVGPGDRIAAFMPNVIETVVAMLGATSIGAVWSSTSPDFGFQGVMDRFGQIDPTVLLCADGYRYNGKAHGTLDKAAHLAASIPSVRHVITVPFLGERPAGSPGAPAGALAWEDFIALGAVDAIVAGEPRMAFPQTPFDTPVYILYSSGTTGQPKCIVHGAGGTLLKHHVEQKFHTDIRRDDTLFYYTTCGWMMWNWLVSGLAQGCTVALYDGSPSYPDLSRPFRMAEELGITVLGTSPKFLAACQKAGLAPAERHDLSRLRTVLSTGAPLEAHQFHYVHDAIRRDVQLASISGGTDIIGCFMLGNPLQPVHAGEIQGPALGVDIAAFDESGAPVRGRQGELVCRRPIPSMPIGFWKDPGNARYRKTYFADYPGVWRHGDFITLTGSGGVIVSGRSDATLNPGGVRIGTAEIYRVVEDLPEVVDSIVVGHRAEGDEHIVLFVVLAPGLALSPALQDRIRAAIRERTTPRHVPAHIRQIGEVPVTINGKKVELAVGALLRGETIQNRDALANPAALGQFEGLRF